MLRLLLRRRLGLTIVVKLWRREEPDALRKAAVVKAQRVTHGRMMCNKLKQSGVKTEGVWPWLAARGRQWLDQLGCLSSLMGGLGLLLGVGGERKSVEIDLTFGPVQS